MDVLRLSDLVADQRERFLARPLGVPREVDWQRHRDHGQVVAITGVRRCGKSTLLRQIANELGDGFHYLNFDDERLIRFEVENFEELMLVFEKGGHGRVLLLDEIQNVLHWERFIRRVHDDGWKVYLTGSNARLLSTELGTHLTGRYQALELYPFSFREVLAFAGVEAAGRSTRAKAAILRVFDEYLAEGGFPEYLSYREDDFLTRIYDDVIFRDIVARFSIREVRTFQLLAHYLFTNFTGDMTYRSVQRALGIASPTTVSDYVGFLEQAYLAFEVRRYDCSLKKQHVAGKKIYVIDTGLRNRVAFRFSEDRGKALENLVHLELCRRPGHIHFHRDRGECDFLVVDRGAVVLAVQVCVELHEGNRHRELAGLAAAMSLFPDARGVLLTYNQQEEVDVAGRQAQIVPTWRWLLEAPVWP